MPVDTVIAMTPGRRFRLRKPPGWAAMLAVAFLVMPASAAAMATRANPTDLSPRLAELSKPALRTAPEAVQDEALGVAAEGPGSLLRDGSRVLVDVRFEGGAEAGADDLRAAGARVVNVSSRYRTVTVAAKPAELRAVAAVPRVAGVTEILAPVVSAVGCTGLVTSEGDAQLAAPAARTTFGVNGSGVNVGILSDSFDEDPTAPTRAAQDAASGDLPGPGNPCGYTAPVGVFADLGEPGEATDEGRAMAQIVHDLAPGASISFATAFTGMFAFAQNIRALHAVGARVIVDDVLYPDEPFFQEGPVGVAVNDVTASGSAYFSAAGNNNLIDAEGRDIASWEAPQFRDSESCPAALLALPEFGEGHCMDFDPAEATKDDTFGITVEAGETLFVDLQWAEPWFGVGTDLDLFLLDSSGEPLEVEGGALDNVAKTQRPFESLQWENDGPEQEVQLVVNRCASTCNPEASSAAIPRLKFALLENGGGVSKTEYPESLEGDVVGPTIFGHNGAGNAVSVGAIRYNATTAPEQFSSRGPVTHYFGPVSGPVPAPPLPAAEEISKPDLVATDGAANTFFGPSQSGLPRFFGTSAAAPHAAAVAALMREANPFATFAQMRTALAATATPVGAFEPDAVGAGMVNALGAVSSVALPPKISITERPPALSNETSPRIGFTANRPVTFSCSIDGGGLQPCNSPFVPVAPLSEGVHGFVVRGIDAAGRIGTSETVSFEIDARRPRTFFRKHPPKTIRTRHRRARATFRFGSNEVGATFICKVDSGFLRFCGSRFSRRFSLGKHVVRVKARDAAGNVDRSPAVFRFQVKRIGKR